MILGFTKNKLDVVIKSFKNVEDFHESLIHNDYLAVLTSQFHILNLDLKTIDVFIVEESNIKLLKNVISRALVIGNNQSNGKNNNSMCRIVNEIYSRQINGNIIKVFLPAKITNERLLNELNISRENCIKQSEGYKTTKNIVFEFLRLKSALNLNNA